MGSFTEFVLAFAMVVLLAGILRWTFGTDRSVGALPDPTGDLGLLETVATVPTREAAELLVEKLAAERVRVTISRGEQGWRLLAFPADAEVARRAI